MKKMLIVSLMISFILSFATVGSAMDIGLRGIGGKVGLVIPDYAGDNTFGLGVIADMGTIIPELRAEASIDYWGKSWDVVYYEWSQSVITISGTAKYDFPLGKSFIPFVGGGLGLAINRWSSDWKGQQQTLFGIGNIDVSDTNIDIVFHVVGGVDIPVGKKMILTLEAKYGLGGTDALWLTGGLMIPLQRSQRTIIPAPELATD